MSCAVVVMVFLSLINGGNAGRVPWPKRSEVRAPGGSGVERAHHVLDAGVVLDAVHGQVLAVPGLLETTVRHFGGEENVGVDPNGAEVEVTAQAHRGAMVGRPDARGQGVV